MSSDTQLLMEIRESIGRVEGRADGLHQSLQVVVAQLEAVRVEVRDHGTALAGLQSGCGARAVACDTRFKALSDRQKRASRELGTVREDTDVLRIEEIRREARQSQMRKLASSIWRYGRPVILALIAGSPIAAALYAALK